MTQTGSPFYLLSLSNMLDLIRHTNVHSSSLLYFDGLDTSKGISTLLARELVLLIIKIRVEIIIF